MKKIITLLCVLAMALSLVACGEKFHCDFCEKDKSGTKYTTEILGEEITYCKDCKKAIEKSLGSLDFDF